MIIRNAWYVAAWSHEVTEKPLARRLCDKPVVLFRDAGGKAAALLDQCCHRGAPLHFGTVVPQGLQCGYHGLVFAPSGQCVSIPGQDRIPDRARVESFPVVEKDEMLWIWMGDPALADPAEIFDYPYHNDHANWPHKHQRYSVACNSMLLVDNLMDLTHLGYVHTTTIGGNPQAHVGAKMEVERTPKGLKFTRWMLDVVPPPTYANAVGFTGRVDRWQEFEFVAPGIVHQWTGAVKIGTGAQQGNRQGGFSMRIFHGLTPETETSCFYFWTASNGYRQDDPAATEQMFQQIDEAFLEDKIIVEQQQSRLDELGEAGLIDIGTDAARIHMRRTVDGLAAREGGRLAAE